jgi:hypothetical protein
MAAVCLAGAAMIVYVASSALESRHTTPGLTLTILDSQGRIVDERPWTNIDLIRLSIPKGLQGQPWSARLRGEWRVPETGVYRFIAKLKGRASVRIAGQEVITTSVGSAEPRLESEARLEAGYAPIEIEFTPTGKSTFLRMRAALAGRTPRLIPPDQLYAGPAWHKEQPLRRIGAIGQRVGEVMFIAAIALIVFMAASERRRAARWPWWFATVFFPALVVIFGGLLRFEALVARNWSHEAPPWAFRLAADVTRLRFFGEPWTTDPHAYTGDPSNYLILGRAWRGFYDAHAREPVFVAATHGFLKLVGNGDIAVSLASSSFSTLVVAATFVLGRVASGTTVGLLAAVFVAIDPQSISMGVEGWRDDAFAFFTVMSAALFMSMRRHGRLRDGVGLGIAGGFAILTRITSLSFLAPSLALMAASPSRRKRWRAALIAALLIIVIVAPFLLSCAIAFGDPLFAVNYHTRGFYRIHKGERPGAPMAWSQYLLSTRHPWELLDLGVMGLTIHPFESQWPGFASLLPGLDLLLAAAAALGLLLWATSAAGRWLLLLLLTALLPFAFTWDLAGGGELRYTLFALPFCLVAAFSVLVNIALLSRREARLSLRARWRKAVWRAVVALSGFMLLWLALETVHHRRFVADLDRENPSEIEAGQRDAFFFGRGWSRPKRRGDMTLRWMEKESANVRLPLRAGHAYGVTLALLPACEDIERLPVSILLNGTLLANLDTARPVDPLGRHYVDLPALRVRDGANDVAFRLAYVPSEKEKCGGGAMLALRFFQVIPRRAALIEPPQAQPSR